MTLLNAAVKNKKPTTYEDCGLFKNLMIFLAKTWQKLKTYNGNKRWVKRTFK